MERPTIRAAALALAPALALTLALTGPAVAQTTLRVTLDANGQQVGGSSQYSSLSADGRFVAFDSGADLVPPDTNGNDIFVRDLQLGTIERVSLSTGGAEAGGMNIFPRISPDGRFVSWEAEGPNLVANDTNGVRDVFVRDRPLGTTDRASVDSAGAEGNGESGWNAISADGRMVAFNSAATNLVAGDTNGFYDVFVHDRQTGVTQRISVGPGGVEGDGECGGVAISNDGRFVAFYSSSTNLGPLDANAEWDCYVHDLQTGTNELVSLDSAGNQANDQSAYDLPAISADGRYVAFESVATNLYPGDPGPSWNVFRRDRLTGTTIRATVPFSGSPTTGGGVFPSISADGRVVAFQTSSQMVQDDNTNHQDAYVRDLVTGTTTRASVTHQGLQALGHTYFPSLSGDGRRVSFHSLADNIVPNDTQFSDQFVRVSETITSFCFGDGTDVPCPCGNTGLPEQGCDNSQATGGSTLTALGSASLGADWMLLSASGEMPTALSIFLQGNQRIAPVVYGDGLRCVGGALKRLYAKSAVNGSVSAPQGGDLSISARSAAAGDPIPMGSTRWYQTYYRDANAGFCPIPVGSTFNVSNGLQILWGP